MFNKKMKSVIKSAGMSMFACAALLSAGSAGAVTMLGQAPDPSLIVQAGGFEWVYAGPCAGLQPSCGVVQLHHGFEFATDDQWNASFSDLSALMAAFHTTSSPLCASAYFNTQYDHCDGGDVGLGYVWHSPLAPSLGQRNSTAAETFLVRAPAVSDVPEPGSLALIGLGLAGFAAARRRQAAKK
ncbi:PEP-CTERM sorting domain-containing protein [Massilia sp. R2A-15]|uniref:PEP-CTERM sorting domain-containing protein n=1 Tax=Massilia sp. R2A-15 TaxID=3064278 RepID=UPI0027339C16|nr:PEP-CTERM sorting domain-containing protein [Massilia sp. R2A-15]WLI90953.1 PEP-CTERM sorting domain-containing protein [Massilia sp. R2A-15]